jgi:hypothetical protein
MLWQQRPDCYNQLVAENIRRREVEAVLACLHFRDNGQMDNDGYFKVQLVVSIFMVFPPNLILFLKF